MSAEKVEIIGDSQTKQETNERLRLFFFHARNRSTHRFPGGVASSRISTFDFRSRRRRGLPPPARPLLLVRSNVADLPPALFVN